ncbi:MAG: hypothetical protein ACLUEK_03085 [Oscillospiraceae bacterium]
MSKKLMERAGGPNALTFGKSNARSMSRALRASSLQTWRARTRPRRVSPR